MGEGKHKSENIPSVGHFANSKLPEKQSAWRVQWDAGLGEQIQTKLRRFLITNIPRFYDIDINEQPKVLKNEKDSSALS